MRRPVWSRASAVLWGAGGHEASPRVRRATSRALVLAVALVVACLLAQAVFARWGSNLMPYYRPFSRSLMAVLATLASPAPFAVWDIVAVVLVVGAVVSIVHRMHSGRPVLPVLAGLCLVVSVAHALIVGGWALNHYAPPLSGELNLEVSSYTADELEAATRAYLEQAADLAPQVPRDEQGALARQEFFELAHIAGAAYGPLAREYPIFQGPNVPVKALLVWGEPLLYSGHTGIFFAATGEAGVPLNCSVADTPFIMCHEAAHRLGIASEQEANFAAYLACSASDDVRFCYAGSYSAFAYCFNALYRVDRERALALLDDAATWENASGAALVWGDYVANARYYEAYDGPFEKVGQQVNDHYLKSYGQQAGVQSYGLVVDYLIAWHQRSM